MVRSASLARLGAVMVAVHHMEPVALGEHAALDQV
jgi:hypothetical protein